MKFKTIREKRAFRMGCAVGCKYKKRKKKVAARRSHKKQLPYKKPLFTDDFEYTKSGRIKGAYTVDGFFEPD